MTAPCVLDLRVTVTAHRREAFFAFLREAIPVYERPGGIRVELLERLDRPGAFIERITYATRADFDADQQRVAQDPELRGLIARWRELLDGEPEVVPLATLRL